MAVVHMPEFGAGLWMFQQFIDRYATDAYGPPVGTIDAIALAAQVGELAAVDINYPFAGDNVSVSDVRNALRQHGLRCAAITPVIVSREYRMGSFTNPDPTVRARTYDLVRESTEVAHALGADYVKLWPGQDGFDYPFQVDYRQLWDLAVTGVRAVANADPSMRFAIEYKPKEPRTHMFFSSADRTLLCIQDMGVDNVGIVMDLGHSLYGKETPAESVQIVAQRGKLYGVDLNDNWREWDDDLAVGSVHLIETLEFIDALLRIGWDGLWQLDQFPFRENPVEAARLSLQGIHGLIGLLQRVDMDALRVAQQQQSGLAAQRVIQAALLGVGVAR